MHDARGPLPEETARLIALLDEAARGGPAIDAVSPAEIRGFYDRVWERFGAGGPPEISARDVMVGAVKARLYSAGAEGLKPVIVYSHGGGWVLLNLDSHDRICRLIAKGAGLAVLSLDYPLAPENPYPSALNACVAALRWVAERGASLGLDPSRIAVMGDSAGANLSLATMIRCRDEGVALKAGLLVYGAYDDDFNTPSHRAFGGGEFPLSTKEVAWYFDAYCPPSQQGRPPSAVPLRGDLAGLPPLYIAAAEFDCLRSESESLAARLAAIGAPHRFRLWRGMIHGCLLLDRQAPSMGAHIAELCAAARAWMG